MMTQSEYSIVFRLLDDFARNRHRCFVAEFFLDKSGTTYHICFRPTDVGRDSPERFACRYLDIPIGEVMDAAQSGVLPAPVVTLMDRELPTLGRSR